MWGLVSYGSTRMSGCYWHPPTYRGRVLAGRTSDVGLACSRFYNRVFCSRALVCAGLREAEVIRYGYHDNHRRCAYRSAACVPLRHVAATGEILK